MIEPSHQNTGIPGDARERPSVVAIGASAGGLSALKSFLSRIPERPDLAFVVVVHLNPEHESHLAELLQSHVRMPVIQVTETMGLQRDHVYVIAPGTMLSSVDTHLRLSESRPGSVRRAPIDHFFRTLAATHDGHSVGVILSGTGSDGALGIKAIKEQHGFTLVQDPEEAEFDGMPRSAIATGMVDHVLPIAELAEAVMRLVRTEPQLDVPAGGEDIQAEQARLLDRIFTHVRARTGRDFSRYKRSTLLRRIQRRMQLRQVADLNDYLKLLLTEPGEVRALADDILITVTNFFRDPSTWSYLEQEVIPDLFATKPAEEPIRVWSVGCATGEEAYSLAILLLEESERRESSRPIQVFASDLHENSLARARDGFYPGDIDADVSPERLRRFFHSEDGGYRVRKEVREKVVFAPHNLLSDPPFSRLDLVCCRNVLIYLQPDVQRDITELFHYALRPAGVLVLGSSETVNGSALFRVESKPHCVFRKRNVPGAEHRLPVLPARHADVAAIPDAPARTGTAPAYGALHDDLVRQHARPSMLVSPDGKAVHFSRDAGRYLVIPGGEPTTSAFKLVREELRIELRAALHSVRETRQAARSRPIPVRLQEQSVWVVLEVHPAERPEQTGYALVLFDEREPVEARAADAATDVSSDDSQAELEITKQRLHAIVEAFEITQDEMRASHEELQSANEELRSTLEELETSREELQSMNEELQTVNQENRHKVEELSQLSGDLQNLLASTEIATLFLDRELRILRFTRQIGELFNVRSVDRGRPLSDLTNRLGYPEIRADAEAVLLRLTPLEREVRDERGRWYLTRVHPYRSTDDRIEGVVITFVDITDRRAAEEAFRDSEQRIRTLADALPEIIWIADGDGRIEFLNRQWTLYTGKTFDAASSLDIASLAVHPDDAAETLRLFGEARRAGTSFSCEHRIRSVSGDYRWFLVRAQPAETPTAGGALRWYGVSMDIHDRKLAESAVRELTDTLELRVQERTAELRQQKDRLQTLIQACALMVWSTDPAGQVVEDSPSWRDFTGQSREEWLGTGWVNAVHPDDRTFARENWFSSVQRATPVNAEFRIWHDASRSYRWTNVRADPLRDDEGRIAGWVGMNIDVHRSRDAEEARKAVMLQLVSAEENERRRISRELHDQMSQQLTGLTLGLHSLRQRSDVSGIQEELQRLEQLTNAIASDIQYLALELRPPALDNLGLQLAIQNLLDEWSRRHGVRFDFHATNLKERLEAETETSLYRAVQEALTNVAKHAHASHVDVLVERRGGTVRAVIEDDGSGFDVDAVIAAPDKARRLGLRGMTERIALLGGSVHIESAPGSGTTIYVRIPDNVRPGSTHSDGAG